MSIDCCSLQEGLVNLCTFEVSKGCRIIEQAGAKRAAVLQLLNQGARTQAMNTLRQDLVRQRALVAVTWDNVKKWLAYKGDDPLPTFLRPWAVVVGMARISAWYLLFVTM